METVKATLPRHLHQLLESSHVDDLDNTCSELASHFASNVTCSQLLEQLAHPNKTTCAKDLETALHCKTEGNEAFKQSSFPQALDSYTKALRYVPLGADADMAILATLFVNRAAALHALGLLDAAARDCARGIKLQPQYSKAWYRRGRVFIDLQSYARATADLEQALLLEKSLHGKNQVSHELGKVKGLISSVVEPAKKFDESVQDCRKWKAGECSSVDGVCPYWTVEKQWGLQATEKLDAGSLILEEEAVAAVILKAHRNTHCHYCFELLPPDCVPCKACAITLYCHEGCRSAACDDESFPVEDLDGRRRVAGEHVHECGGASWSAVLPTDAVLAARLYVRCHGNESLRKELYKLCHHYNEMSNASKVNVHILATVIAHCLSYGAVRSFQEAMGDLAAKLVNLIAIVRANAMGIFAVQQHGNKTASSIQSLKYNNIDKSLLTLVEQVNVAQGIYLLGSKMNHSCITNVHASFKNRRVRVRTILPVQAGSPLELCYGAQVGEMRRDERSAWLQERYFFTCACPSCTTIAQHDLLLDAFRCSKMGCDGVVPGLTFSEEQPDDHVARDSTKGETATSGCCILCGTIVDMKYYREAAKTAKMELERLQSKLQLPRSNEEALLKGAINLLKLCHIFHPLSKQLAKVQDAVAQAYCSIGRPHDALPHCRLAIQILENIYGKDHIAVANERLKLASIAVVADAGNEVQSNLASVDQVMRLHYGADYHSLLHLEEAFYQHVEDNAGSQGCYTKFDN